MKLYKDMTASEQLKWITDFSQFTTDRLPLLEKLGDAWEQSDRKDMETGLRLIQAFQFAQNFARNSLQLGDYSRRVVRLRYYVDKIKSDLAKGIAVQGVNGETYAYIPALQRRARRGRPTREEAYQRQLNKQAENAPDVKTQEKIAALLGMHVVTDKEAREKNNEELAAEKEARLKEQEKISPSLFDMNNDKDIPSGGDNSSSFDKKPSPSDYTGSADFADSQNNSQNDETKGNNNTKNIHEGNDEDGDQSKPLSESLPHLDQIKWLLPKDLQARVDNIRSLRATASASAERAKTLAEVGANADDITPWTKQAQDATKEYENTYEQIDRELAKVWLRFREDEHYLAQMAKDYQLKDPSQLIKMLRPYYNKVSTADPLFTTNVRAWIDANNPEAVAKREAAKDRKKKADAIIKYLRRQDKLPTKKRIEGMQKKYKELVELIGEEAKEYMPFIEKTIEDNKAYEAGKKQKSEKK